MMKIVEGSEWTATRMKTNMKFDQMKSEYDLPGKLNNNTFLIVFLNESWTFCKYRSPWKLFLLHHAATYLQLLAHIENWNSDDQFRRRQQLFDDITKLTNWNDWRMVPSAVFENTDWIQIIVTFVWSLVNCCQFEINLAFKSVQYY